MNVIYVGVVPPKHLEEEIISLGSFIDFAGFTFQKTLVSGLDNWYPNLRVVSSIRVDAYPKVKKLFFKPESYTHKGGATEDDRFVGIVNIPIAKRVFLFLNLRKEIKKMLRANDENVIITYSMPSYQLLAVASLRKYLKKSCLIVPDLPEFMSEEKNILRTLAKYFDRKLINWSLKSIDTFALLSSHMAERLPIEGKKWVQMEGLYSDSFEGGVVEKEAQNIILYTGAMGRRYGVDDLIEAFMMIKDSNYRLWIRGNGASEADIKKMEEKDSRIKYIPPMPKKDLLELLKRATVLVNPVPRSQVFTRFFFPSKTMEYLASGTPVVMYHLDCIPREYDEHIFYVENDGIKGLRAKLLEVCTMDKKQLLEHGVRARDFILSHKNAVVQTKKIYDLLIEE